MGRKPYPLAIISALIASGTLPRFDRPPLGLQRVGGHDHLRASVTRAVPVEDVDLTTTNNLAAFHLLMQLRAPGGPVRPYLEGRFGGQYLWTESKLEDQDFWDDDEVGKEVNYDDFALVYGGGGVGNGGGLEGDDIPSHGYPASLSLTLPPLGVLFLLEEGNPAHE